MCLMVLIKKMIGVNMMNDACAAFAMNDVIKIFMGLWFFASLMFILRLSANKVEEYDLPYWMILIAGTCIFVIWQIGWHFIVSLI